MTAARMALAVGIVALSAVGGWAQSDKPIAPIKPVTAPARRFELPFDVKTEPDMKFRGAGVEGAPTALTPTTREHHPFIGLGVSRPIETGR